MRRSKEHVAQNRERIVTAAARLLREHGLNGIGVTDLMAAAGMTNGAFYTYFDSRESLVEEACARAFRDTVARWDRPEGSTLTELQHIVETYLSSLHADNLGEGCAVAALGGDLARAGPEVRAASWRGVERMIDLIAQAVPARSPAARRKRATGIASTLVGSLVLARLARGAEDTESILAAGREHALSPS